MAPRSLAAYRTPLSRRWGWMPQQVRPTCHPSDGEVGAPSPGYRTRCRVAAPSLQYRHVLLYVSLPTVRPNARGVRRATCQHAWHVKKAMRGVVHSTYDVRLGGTGAVSGDSAPVPLFPAISRNTRRRNSKPTKGNVADQTYWP
jgi:hypothetical protein